MNRGWTILRTAACIGGLTLAAHAGETASFQLIPGMRSANDLSADGRFIVGESVSFAPYLLDRQTGVITNLPSPGFNPIAVSDDGQVVLGSLLDVDTGAEVAAIWKASTNTWQSLGYLPNANQCPSLSSAYELSADGTVAVGLSWDGCSGRGFRWTEATGMEELEGLANGGNRASVVSADGDVIGGFAQGSFSRTPSFWNSSGSGELLDPPAGDAIGEVHGISDDGTILLGEWNGDAVKWTMPGMNMEVLGAGQVLPGWTGIPLDIADDQGTIVGFDILLGNRRAWIQVAGSSLKSLDGYVTTLGGVIPANTTLEVAQAISRDGRVIIGHGFNSGAWIIEITPEPQLTCLGDVVGDDFSPPGDGAVDGFDLAYLLGEWGRNPGSDADLVGDDFTPPADGMVNGFDLAVLLGAWGACE